MDAPKLLQYRHVIQNLYEWGGNWRGYDVSFRTLRSVERWPWDHMHSQLWLMSAQQPAAKAAPHVRPPFLNKGPGQCSMCTCYAINIKGQCAFSPCRFKQCQQVVWVAHPGFRCPSHKRAPVSNTRGGLIIIIKAFI